MRRLLLAALVAAASIMGCGSEPCPPFKKAVCGGCGEKSPACRSLLESLERAREEGRDLDTLCEKGHEFFKELSGDRCGVVLPTSE